MTTLRALIAAGLVVGMFGAAVAKLPPPAPPTDAQKAAAEEKKAKDAAAAEAAKAQQVKAEDRAAANYFANMKAKGKTVAPPQTAAVAPAAAPAKAEPAKAEGCFRAEEVDIFNRQKGGPCDGPFLCLSATGNRRITPALREPV